MYAIRIAAKCQRRLPYADRDTFRIDLKTEVETSGIVRPAGEALSVAADGRLWKACC